MLPRAAGKDAFVLGGLVSEWPLPGANDEIAYLSWRGDALNVDAFISGYAPSAARAAPKDDRMPVSASGLIRE